MTTSISGTPQLALDAAAVHAATQRMAQAIAGTTGGGNLAWVGVRTRGVPLARRLAPLVAALRPPAEGTIAPPPEVGSLDIGLYRDDLSGRARPWVGPTEIPFSIDGRVVILVDDVLYSGRTVRAALDALVDLGRPAAVRLAVLVDRGHRELPIHADFIGTTLVTRSNERVHVRLSEIDTNDSVWVTH